MLEKGKEEAGIKGIFVNSIRCKSRKGMPLKAIATRTRKKKKKEED